MLNLNSELVLLALNSYYHSTAQHLRELKRTKAEWINRYGIEFYNDKYISLEGRLDAINNECNKIQDYYCYYKDIESEEETEW